MKKPTLYGPIASKYADFIKKAKTEWTLGYPAVFRFIEPFNDARILDLGCGTGEVTAVMAEKGAHVTGIDISREMIAKAKQQYGHLATFAVTSADKLRQKFDACTCNFVLCTIADRKRIRDLLTQAYKALKPGGLFVAINDNWLRANGREFASFRLNQEELRSGRPVSVTLKTDPPLQLQDIYWSHEDYIGFLESAGFNKVTLHEVTAYDPPEPEWIDEKKHSPFIIATGQR